jgi:hypothetical protein
MSYYCEDCEEPLGDVSTLAYRHRNRGHAVLAFR